MMRHRLCVCALLLILSGFSWSCSILGYVAAVAPRPNVGARYKGLAGQRVAVVTWAPQQIYWHYHSFASDIRHDVSRLVRYVLSTQAKADELKGTELLDVARAYRWQKNHPEIEGKSLAEFAPQLAKETGATRIIYIELADFTTRDPRTMVLLKGVAVASVQVAEIDQGRAKIGYTEAGIPADYPPKTPEGVPETDTLNETHIYDGLTKMLSAEIAKRFFPYESD